MGKKESRRPRSANRGGSRHRNSQPKRKPRACPACRYRPDDRQQHRADCTVLAGLDVAARSDLLWFMLDPDQIVRLRDVTAAEADHVNLLAGFRPTTVQVRLFGPVHLERRYSDGTDFAVATAIGGAQ